MVRRGHNGFTIVELMVAFVILLVLSSLALPTLRWEEKRRREAHLKVHLSMLRHAIDQYKKYSDEGLIVQSDVEQMGFPLTLEELAEGVEVGDPQAPDSQTIVFLQRIPVDPFTGVAEWGLRSYQDDWDADSWGGENIYDVYSLSNMRALDDTYYKDW